MFNPKKYSGKQSFSSSKETFSSSKQSFSSSKETFSSSKKRLKIIPLGGVGDVTKNMYIYEYGDDIVIIDCGVGFPDEGMLGIDLVIPDITYLKDKKHKIRGILITHAHDDHIGSLPYIWPELNVPIYCQKLTGGLIRSKFTEHGLPKDKIKIAPLNASLRLGVFEASFYLVSHSIPDSTGIILKTPEGTLIHQADFKMDWTPVNNQVTDVGAVARVGEKGVIFMAIDCLRVEKQGYTLSEKTIEGTFEKIEKETEGKLLITMTSSNLTRVQQAINVATRTQRKLALVGRSMENNFQVARDLGYLDVSPGLLIAQEDIKRFPEDKLMILIAGAQGQQGSALSRVANRDHKFVYLKKDDSVVFSADPIPGTESAQNTLIDLLTVNGANVYYTSMMSDLHVSGHASSEEIKLMINLAKPKYLLPIGGTFKHMKSFLRMAKDMGYKDHQILMAQDGDKIEVGQGSAKITSRIDVSNVYVDGLGVGDIGSVVLKDRRVMSEEGIVVVVVPVSIQTGKIVGKLDIISRGFVFGEIAQDLLDSAKEIAKSSLKDHRGPIDFRYLRHTLEDELGKFFHAETKRNPLILTVVIEV